MDATPFGPYQLQELFGRGSMGRWTIPRATQGTRSIRRGSVSPDGLSPRPFSDDAADWKMRAEVWRNRDAVIGGSDAGAHRT